MERSILKNPLNSVEPQRPDDSLDNTEPIPGTLGEGAETIPLGSRVQADPKKRRSGFVCKECSKSNIKYFALGMCNSCYKADYYQRNIEKRCQYNRDRYHNNPVIKEITKERAIQSYRKNPLPVKLRSRAKYHADPKQNNVDRLERKYGHNYHRVFDRDFWICQVCKTTRQLCVHHKDQDKKNNKLSNLITLCKACHARLHHKGVKNPNKNAWKNGTRPRYSPNSQVTARASEEASGA